MIIFRTFTWWNQFFKETHPCLPGSREWWGQLQELQGLQEELIHIDKQLSTQALTDDMVPGLHDRQGWVLLDCHSPDIVDKLYKQVEMGQDPHHPLVRLTSNLSKGRGRTRPSGPMNKSDRIRPPIMKLELTPWSIVSLKFNFFNIFYSRGWTSKILLR